MRRMKNTEAQPSRNLKSAARIERRNIVKKRCKFYVVIRGYRCGILDNWMRCKSYVDGYGGNQYKGFLYLEDALAYMKQSLEGEEGPYIYEVNEEQQEFQRAEDLLNFVQEKTNGKR